MSSCRIFVVRHGQSTNNRDGLISGYEADPDLTDEGIMQVKRTRGKLAHIKFDEVYSSDLRRAANTAAIIYGEVVPSHHQVSALRERKFGVIDGKPDHHLAKLRDTAHYQSLSHKDRWTHKLADDIESDHEVATRFEQALIKIAEQHMGETILVGAHGAALRTLLVHLGYARTEELQYGSIDNAAFAELLYDGSKFTFGETGGIHLTPHKT